MQTCTYVQVAHVAMQSFHQGGVGDTKYTFSSHTHLIFTREVIIHTKKHQQRKKIYRFNCGDADGEPSERLCAKGCEGLVRGHPVPAILPSKRARLLKANRHPTEQSCRHNQKAHCEISKKKTHKPLDNDTSIILDAIERGNTMELTRRKLFVAQSGCILGTKSSQTNQKEKSTTTMLTTERLYVQSHGKKK